MIPFNQVPASTVYYIYFSSYGKTNGESITLTGLAVTDIEIYKNGSVTQRASDAGYALLDTDGIDFDAITGIHGFSIDLGDNTDAGFYAVGSQYVVVVSAVTVDAQTVNFIADRFRIVAAEATTGKPDVTADVIKWLGQACAAVSVNGVPEVDVTHLLGTAWLTPGTAGTPDVNAKLLGAAPVTATTSVTIPAASTLATTAGAVGSVTGAVGSVTGLTASNLDATISSRMATYTQPTGFLAASFPTDPADQSLVIAATDAIIAAIAALNNISTAQVNAEVVDVIRTDTPAELAAIPAAAPNLHAMVQLVYMALRNKIDVTATVKEVHTDAGVVLATKTLSDDATTYSESKMA